MSKDARLTRPYRPHPVLAEKLHRFMPKEVPIALFEANDRLGKGMGLTERSAEAKVIALTAVHAHLQRQITAYVRCIVLVGHGGLSP